MNLVAGIDSSTQGCKIVIINSSTGEIVRQGRAPHPAGTEIHPDRWFDALRECVKDAGGIRDVSAISISGQQHGLVALNAKGEVIRPALLWNDTRSAPSAEALIRELGGPEIYAKRVGIVPVASFTASKLRWLRDNEPANAASLAAVALPHDWLTWRLLGYGPENPDLEALVTDRSDASGTAYWSGETGEYDEELFFHALGRPMRVARGSDSQAMESENEHNNAVIVPRVLSPNMVAGITDNSPVGETDGSIVVGAGSGDNAGGALGLGVTSADIVVSLGTSGAVFSPVEHSLGDGDPSGIVAGFSSAAGTHLPLVCTLNAARIIEAGARLLRINDGPAGLTPLALAASPGSNGLVLLPYFEGERTPNLPTAKASLHNLTLANATPENLARACVESLICSMAQAINAINSSAQGTEKKIRVLLIGGASVSKAVQDVAATIFDVKTIIVPVPEEYVAKGAAVQATWAFSGTKPLWKLAIEREIPCENHPQILRQYEEVFNKAYKN